MSISVPPPHTPTCMHTLPRAHTSTPSPLHACQAGSLLGCCASCAGDAFGCPLPFPRSPALLFKWFKTLLSTLPEGHLPRLQLAAKISLSAANCLLFAHWESRREVRGTSKRPPRAGNINDYRHLSGALCACSFLASLSLSRHPPLCLPSQCSHQVRLDIHLCSADAPGKPPNDKSNKERQGDAGRETKGPRKAGPGKACLGDPLLPLPSHLHPILKMQFN